MEGAFGSGTAIVLLPLWSGS